jgi:hypothetical protein
MYIYCIVFIFSSLVSGVLCSDGVVKPKHVIGCHKGAGFFSAFFGALNHIAWCEKVGKLPVVYWGKSSLYYNPANTTSAYNNAWEYYFKPVSESGYDSVDVIHTKYAAPDGSIFVYKCWNKGATENIYQLAYRLKVKKLIDTYIKIRIPIQNKIDHFYDKHMKGKKTIGIHLRGTDNHAEAKPISLKKVFALANEYKGYQFFIATDEYALLQKAKRNLHGKVLYYASQRSSNSNPIHHSNSKYNKAQAGEEVLIEAQLLSRCQFFIHGCSNVSSAVLCLNPYLKQRTF